MRTLALIVALSLPLPLGAVGAGALADRLGRDLGASLGRVAAGLGGSDDRAEPAPVVIAPLAEAESGPEPEPVIRRLPARGKAPAQRGVYVRADAVLRLARIGARPSAVAVRAAGDRPAGLALVGVSGLGVGLADGDILTHAAGAPARSPGQVVGLVIASRGARAEQISGRFWRRGEYFNLVVEQPYLAQKRGAPDS